MTMCTSCKKETQDFIRLACPKCKKEISRCAKCRNLSIDYKCSCGHVGP